MTTYSIRQLSRKEMDRINSCIMCDTNKYLQMLRLNVDTDYQIKCMSCFCTGPQMQSRAAAIDAWNSITS